MPTEAARNQMLSTEQSKHQSSFQSTQMAKDKNLNNNTQTSIHVSPTRNQDILGNNQLMMMTAGKTSLMHRMQSSPAPIVKNMDATRKMSQTTASKMMASTLAGTGMDNTRASPFRDTISKGMITGIGLLNKESITKPN